MGNLHALAIRRKPHAMLTHHIPGADGFEAYDMAWPRAGMALPTVNGYLRQVTTQGRGDDLTHAQGCTRGGV